MTGDRLGPDLSEDAVLDRVVSGSRRAELRRAADRQRQRAARFAGLGIVAVTLGGLWAIAGRGDDASAPAVSSPSTLVPRCLPDRGDGRDGSRNPETEGTGTDCLDLLEALSRAVNSRCLPAQSANDAVREVLGDADIADTWTVDTSEFEGCATVWVDLDDQVVHITDMVVSCPTTHGDASAGAEAAAECATLAMNLREHINGHCLAPDSLAAAATGLTPDDWQVSVEGPGRCPLAWVDGTTRTVTIADTPPR